MVQGTKFIDVDVCFVDVSISVIADEITWSRNMKIRCPLCVKSVEILTEVRNY